MKKFLSLILCLLLTCSLFCGCSKEVDKIDDTKYQLNIGVFQGGIGTAYLNTIIKNFEEEYSDYTRDGDNRVGIQVHYLEDKDKFESSQLKADGKNKTQDIFIVNELSYRTLTELGVIADITDILTEKVYGADGNLGGNTMSIEDKMLSVYQNFYNLGTSQNKKYHAIPYSASPMGIVYDKDLFEDMGYYFDDAGDATTGVSPDNPKSKGQDGIQGTYDDGLPKNWTEFKKLLSNIRGDLNIPFTWASGQNIFYKTAPLTAVWANYEGSTDFMLNYSFNGTDGTLGAITEENAYKLFDQEGRKAALAVGYEIIKSNSGKNFSSSAFGTKQSNIEAQKEFLRSTTKTHPIAMLFEGGWWENEAKSIFNEMAKDSSEYAYGTRNFGFMPVPKIETGELTDVSGQTSNERTMYLSQEGAAICVRSTTKNMDICKLFIQYLHSQENLAYFNYITGVFKPFEYTLDSYYNSMTSFAKDIWDMYKDENVKKIVSLPSSEFYNYKSNEFDKEWAAKVGSSIFNDPLTAFRFETFTVSDYFDGFKAQFTESKWSEWYQDYLSSKED